MPRVVDMFVNIVETRRRPPAGRGFALALKVLFNRFDSLGLCCFHFVQSCPSFCSSQAGSRTVRAHPIPEFALSRCTCGFAGQGSVAVFVRVGVVGHWLEPCRRMMRRSAIIVMR